MLHNASSEEVFPNINPRPLLAQLEAYCFSVREEANHHLTTASFQVAVENNKVSPKHRLLQDAIGLGHLSTLLARIQPAINHCPQVPFCQAAFQLVTHLPACSTAWGCAPGAAPSTEPC